ncbi:hypothetical protein ACHAXH_008769 [Discostella pseudostelligera]
MGYGSTTSPTPKPSHGSSYTTPYQTSSSSPMHRTESCGGDTARTTETEPLLGERLLHDSLLLSPDPGDVDVSTIEGIESDHEMDFSFSATAAAIKKGRNASTPMMSGSARKQIPRLESDPHIGVNVITNETDTLAYSRDPDESTLFTTDLFSKMHVRLSILDDVSRRLFPKRENPDVAFSLVCLGLFVGVGLCFIAAIAYTETTHSTDKSTTVSSPESTWHGVPFTKVDRESFGDPVSNIMDVSLFHQSLLYGGRSLTEKSDYVHNQDHVQSSATSHNYNNDERSLRYSPKPFLRVPFPTGAFWTNLVLLPLNEQTKQQRPSSTQHDETPPLLQKKQNQYSYPIVAYPYSFQWSPLGKLQASYSASRRVIQANSIQDAFAPDVTLGSTEEIHTRHVVRFDSLSVTLRFYSGDANAGSSSKGSGQWESYIVQGSPYITSKYSGLSPELTALSDFDDVSCPPTIGDEVLPDADDKKLGICAIVQESSSKQRKVVTGVQFVVTTMEGLTWLVFASEPITLELNYDARRSISSRDKFDGVIRLALVPPTTSASTTMTSTSGGTNSKKVSDLERLFRSPGVKRLLYHAGAYPVSGTVSWDFRSGSRKPLASSHDANNSGKKIHRRISDQHVERQLTSAEMPKENSIGRITFSYETIGMTSTTSPATNVPLLTLALPHHAASITTAEELLLQEDDFDLTYWSIKGQMVPVIGDSWAYEEELTFTAFGDDPSLESSQLSVNNESKAILALDQSIRDLLLQTVLSDLDVNLPDLSNGAYGAGKQIARLAQLAHIAQVVHAANVHVVDEEVNRIMNNTVTQPKPLEAESSLVPIENAASSVPTEKNKISSGTSRKAYALLEKYLTLWLGDQKEKRLVYDAQLGGILSTKGMEDVNADFGNSRYNDHHFHYGYVLFAAAILGRANPSFISLYGPYVDALFYDVAHNGAHTSSDSDIFFPLARHKSWFDGHSFASGLFPFANGKSQESSSEAVNCYYGAYLWSKVRWGNSGDSKIVDYARLLLATELMGAKTYWHMPPSQNNQTGDGTNGGVPVAYTNEFRKNFMVGNLGMTDVSCTTWFGNDNIYVHLINFMPITPITAELFDKGFVEGEQSVIRTSDSVEIAWKGYSICNDAILHPNTAWIDAQKLASVQLDPGLSKSQVLFWISTRDGFSTNTTAKLSYNSDFSENESSEGQSASSSESADCANNEKCTAANIAGSCCPTNDGTFLICCS